MTSILTYTSRLAPTPSGYLHAGNAFSFTLTWLLVRQSGGKLHLRIDDIDAERTRPEYVEDIFQSLNWLGLDWDTGPVSPEDFVERHSQLRRLEGYNQLLNSLEQAGKLYACNCSRAQIATSSVNGIYPGTCRHRKLPMNAPETAWRIYVPENTRIAIREISGRETKVPLDTAMGDFVVRRKNGLPAYQIASLADDLQSACNMIVRGSDLIPSTAAQLFMAQQLGLKAFTEAIFYHHPLLRDSTGQKLSKSAGSASLKSLYAAGQSPATLFQMIAKALQLPDQRVKEAKDLLAQFSTTLLPFGRITLPHF